MAISRVAMFVTSDGKSFQSIEAAEAHEFALSAQSEMDDFISANEIPSRTGSTLKQWIPQFIAQMSYIKAPQQMNFAAEDSDDCVSEAEGAVLSVV